MPTLEESFCAAEERALRFLVDDYGFRAVERTVTPEGSTWPGAAVRYQYAGREPNAGRKGWTVSLAYAPHRLELSLDIGDDQGHSFSVEELHELTTSAPVPKATHSLYESIHDEEALFAEFTRLAEALRRSGARFFSGDRSLWAELQARRALHWQAEEDRRAASRSEAAFRAKDWRQVLLELEPREERLTMAEAARLAYARKRLQGAA